MIGSTKRHFVCGGPDFGQFWSEYLETDRRISFVFGLGFDPRSLTCLKKITECDKRDAIEYKAVKYDYSFDQKMQQMVQSNENTVKRMGLRLNETRLPTSDADSMSTAACTVLDEGDFECSDIVVDVTSMPTGVYFPMIRSALSAIKKKGNRTRLYVVVSEDSHLDSKIREPSNSEHSSRMYKFGTSLEQQSLKDMYRVWIPILGHNQSDQLDKITDTITPTNTVPVMPMPSSDPYSARNMTTQYSTIFDNLQIESRNIAYSDERHPSETCAKITSIASAYYELYEGVGGCIIVLSPLASKLLCVGCLMAACELLDDGKKVEVAYVPGRPTIDGYSESEGTPFVIRLDESYDW